MLIGVVSLVLMGVVETVRKADMRVHGALEQEVAGVRYNASRVSLAWQTPQFLLAGVAEAFTLVAGKACQSLRVWGLQGLSSKGKIAALALVLASKMSGLGFAFRLDALASSHL